MLLSMFYFLPYSCSRQRFLNCYVVWVVSYLFVKRTRRLNEIEKKPFVGDRNKAQIITNWFSVYHWWCNIRSPITIWNIWTLKIELRCNLFYFTPFCRASRQSHWFMYCRIEKQKIREWWYKCGVRIGFLFEQLRI